MAENKFKTNLVKELKKRYPGCYVMHLDPQEIQGIPDLLILHKNKWATLEGKDTETAPYRPNQEFYIKDMNEKSFSSMICPENKKEVLKKLDGFFKGGSN